MLVKEIFSQLYNNSFLKNNPFWETSCNLQNQNILKQVEALFKVELMSLFQVYNASEKVIPIIHGHFDEIVMRKNNSNLNEYKEIYTYLQLTWGICAATQLNLNGEFIYCYDIFMKSVFGRTYQNGEEYSLNDIRIFDILNFKNTYIANSKSIIEQWFSQLYYYSKSFSGLNDWCDFFFLDIYYELNENLVIESYHPYYLSNLLTWCEVNQLHKGSKAIRNIIQREFNGIKWSKNKEKNNIKCSLGVQLILCKDYKNDKKEELFRELEENNFLHPLTKMLIIIDLCYDEKSLNRNFDLLIDSIKKFNDDYISIEFQNSIDSIYQRAKIFKNLLNGCISLAICLGRGEMIDKILITYYKIVNHQNVGKIIYFMPNQKGKVIFCLPNKAIIDQKDSQKIIKDVVDMENKAFNSFRLLKGGFSNLNIPNGKPIGQPSSDPSIAKKYEKKLGELYDFSKIEMELECVDSLIQFDFNSFPLQVLMIKTIKKTLPINLSLTQKLDFPKVKTILFWSGGSQTSKPEAEALIEIFSAKNIFFEIHDEENSSLENFVERIKLINPDIIWISAHGEYKHYEPNLSKIHLSDNITIEIRQFNLLVNTQEKRRLMFLNICEGGAHSQTGEFKNLGFPDLLVSNNQDVISHLWMVDSRFAYVFGIFIALGISHKRKNYFEAYCYALSTIMKGKTQILDELNELQLNLSDLKERIINNEGTEWDNIITIGSPVYYI